MPPVKRWSDRPEGQVHVVQRFGVPDKHVSVGAKVAREPVEDALLRGPVEVDDHIAAKDGGEKPLYNCPECSLRYLGRGGGLCLVRFERTSRYRATLGRFTASQVMFFHPEHLQEGRITFFQKIQIARGFSIRGNNVINLAFSRGG